MSGRGKGIARRRRGKGFSYFAASGNPISDSKERERIEALVIPPAWENVWISPDPRGHLQAAGDDADGRRQYLYHPLYRAIRDVAKYDRLRDFVTVLPRIRRRLRADLARPGLHPEKVLAAMVRLIEATYIRVGNERYRQRHDSYGLTTMLCRHLTFEGQAVHFHFMGKSGKEVDVTVQDHSLARILKRCSELPGKRLFQYRLNGAYVRVDSGEINDYLHKLAGERFTAKDFRTWGGTTIVAERLQKLGPAATKTETKRNIVAAVKEAAIALNNTPATCRKYYVHPAVIAAYEKGALSDQIEKAQASGGPHQVPGLKKIERGILAVLIQSSDDAFQQWIAAAKAAA